MNSYKVFSLAVLMLLSLVVASGCTVVHESDDRPRDPEPRHQPEPRHETSINVEITIGHFREPLSSHGTWVTIEGYGDCWYPSDVDDDWRPYSHGHWVWVDECGWYWVSDHEWGWACEHYGRWIHHHNRWHWVPGYEWSGAWVVWREGGGYVGWSALPPSISWSVSVGIRTEGVRWETEIYEPGWVFVEHRHFTSTSVRTVVIRRTEITVIISKTRVRGSVGASNGRPMNHAIRSDEAEKFTGKKPPQRKIEDVPDHKTAREKPEEGEKVRVYRPKVKIEESPKHEPEKTPEHGKEEKPEKEKGHKPEKEEKPGKGK
ncbi:hypothetical protein PLCT2_00318 [Planctomycetaceae bacterium]|nr:hypothetical protein PLCT2_00318 [Planctomycetaceae bacterium]